MSLTVTDILKFRETENDPWQRLLLQANINFNLIYPVGSIYMSTVNVNPATLFGGTWEQLEDRFLLGAGATYTAGDTGGEATHTLTVDEIPSHRHDILASTQGTAFGSAYINPSNGSRNSTDQTELKGGGQPHNNMPPYIVVYMWKRLTLSPSLTPLPMNVLGDVASEDIVPVSKGGTGADNAADARTNLGLSNVKVHQFTASVTLSANVQTYKAFSTSGILTSALQIVGFFLIDAPNTDWVYSSVRYYPSLNELRVYMRNTYSGTITGNIVLNVSYIEVAT